MRYPQVVDDDGRVLRRYGTGAPVTLLVAPTARSRTCRAARSTTSPQLDAPWPSTSGVQL